MGLFGSLGAGMLTSSSMDSANRQNQQNFREQMDFAKYQYENSKQYNSARSQVARLRSAGLNPILAMQGGAQAGQVSAVSQPSPNPQQPVDYSLFLNGASSLMSGLSEAGLFGSKDAENYSSAAKNMADAAKSKAETVRTGVGTAQDRVTLNVMRQTEQALVRQQWNEVMRQELENESIGLQNVYKEFTNGYLPTQLWKSIEKTIAETALAVAQREATPLNARAAMTHAVAAYNESLKQQGFYLTKSQQENLIDATLDFTLSQAYKNWLTPFASGSLKAGVTGFGGSMSAPSPVGVMNASNVARRHKK